MRGVRHTENRREQYRRETVDANIRGVARQFAATDSGFQAHATGPAARARNELAGARLLRGLRGQDDGRPGAGAV